MLVDENDNELGVDSRENCHMGTGKRHRAFVIFLFDTKDRVLIQCRSSKVLLWPECWDVTAASHVYPEETYEEAARRRLVQELGIHDAPLQKVLAFTYSAGFGEYAENEYCALLVGKYEGQVQANEEVVADYKHVYLSEVEKDVRENPNRYTPWFKIALNKFIEYMGDSAQAGSFSKR